jgi:hypothetical protein
MSSSLMIWKPQPGLSQTNVAEIFGKITEGQIRLPDEPLLDKFLNEILAVHPRLEEINPATGSPWAVSPVVADGHVMLGINGDMMSITCDALYQAFKLDLVVYDPQIDLLYDPAWQAECECQELLNRRRAGEI